VIWAIRAIRRSPILRLRPSSDRVRRDKAETWMRVSASTIARRIRAILRTDTRDLLHRCETPVIYLAASRDSVVPPWNADEIASTRPLTEIHTIDGDHMALYTNPRAAAEVISNVVGLHVPQRSQS
jgi:pimeloyl-ACP methyl ester carboxylesterase